MSKQQSGFTLIELIAVIVILGILAATAVPRFINLQDEAAEAALDGVAGSIESSSALNHAVAIAVEAGLTTTATDPFVSVSTCADAALLLMGGLPDGYAITATAADFIPIKAAGTCTLSSPSNVPDVSFVVVGACGGNEGTDHTGCP